METALLYKDEVYAIVGAAMEVHKTLGPGFLEAVYQEALEIELANRQVPFIPQCEVRIQYKDQILNKSYVADFVVYDGIIVELKALDQLTSREEAQLLNYMKATGMSVGLLINFGSSGRLEWKRFAQTLNKV